MVLSICECGALREVRTLIQIYERYDRVPSTEKECVIFVILLLLCASSLSRVRTQALQYSMRGVSYDGKIGFRLNSSLKKGFLYGNNHYWKLQITTLISQSHESSTEGMMCESYWLSLLGNKQEPRLHIFMSSTKSAFQK